MCSAAAIENRAQSAWMATLTRTAIVKAILACTVAAATALVLEGAWGTAQDQGRADTLSRKLSLLERLVNNSATAKRAHSDKNRSGSEIVAQARTLLSQAGEMLARHDYDGAQVRIDRGFKLMAKASRTLGRPTSTRGEEQIRYQKLHRRVVTFTQALNRVYAEKGIDSNSDQTDLQILRHGIEEAESLAGGDDYRDANRTLTSMAEMVEIALTRARHQETLLHELVFTSPEEEYAYEQGRNRSYELLIGLLRNKQGVSDSKLRHFSKIVEQNVAVQKHAQSLADQGDVEGAIKHLERGTERLARALRALGLSF